ncbi:MAG: aminoglycoside phosphotransferase family protein [Candidatus Dormibacterales bacterium]
MAVKMATTPVAERSIAAERSVLSDLARLPGLAAVGIPRLIDYLELGGRRSLVTTAMPGSPMTTRYHAWRHVATESAVRADFAAAESWLARFQSASSLNRAPLDMDGGRMGLLRRRFADDPMTEVLLDRLSSIYGHLSASSTPRTAVHGDFWFGNLLMTGPEITGVIDWEAGAATGEPVLDIVRFALSYALYLDRHARTGTQVAGHPGLRAGEWGAGIVYAVDGRGWFPETVRDFVSGGLTRLGADPSIWREALVAGLADVAATADHLDFATHHWKLFGRLTEASPAAATPSRA